jgi:hypothetical protein
VTSFEYRLHRVGPQVLAGGVVHPFADAPRVFRFFAEFVAEAPDELSVVASTFRAAPPLPVPSEFHGDLVTVLALCYAGNLAEGERVIGPLGRFGAPLADLVAPMPYTALQTASDASYPDGQRNYWKSHYVNEITDEMLARLMEHGPRMPSPLSSFYFQHLGGAIGRPGPDAAAFGHRDAVFDFTWKDTRATSPSAPASRSPCSDRAPGRSSAACTSTRRRTAAAMRRSAPGCALDVADLDGPAARRVSRWLIERWPFEHAIYADRPTT